MKLLDTQPANWDQAIALRTTQQLIAKYGDKINGVWTADDAMMLGAYQAFNQAGRLDKTKFSGEGAYPPVINLMVKKAGNDAVVASAFHRGYMAAATGLLIAYKAAVGEIDVSKLTLSNGMVSMPSAASRRRTLRNIRQTTASGGLA